MTGGQDVVRKHKVVLVPETEPLADGWLVGWQSAVGDGCEKSLVGSWFVGRKLDHG